MANWQEKERQIDQEKTQRENNRRSFRQSEINTILEGFGVKNILEQIRTDVWGEGQIREIIKKDRDGFSYKEGLELVTEVPTVLAFKSPEHGTIYHSGGSSDGISWGEYTTYGVIGYEYQAAIGDIEVSLGVRVGKNTSMVYDRSEGFNSFFVPKTDRVILIEDTPFLKDDKLAEFGRGEIWDGSEDLWFSLFEEESDRYKHYIKGYSSCIEVSYNPVSDKVIKTKDFEEEIVSHVKGRRSTRNLPFQMRERSREFIAKVPYQKADGIIDVMKYFRYLVQKNNSYNDWEFPPKVN